MQPPPSRSVHDLSDGSARDTESLRHFFVREGFGEVSNLSNRLHCEPRLRVARSASAVAVSDHVLAILWPSIPSEIFETIISAIVIFMATFHSFWTRADKGFQNKSVNHNRPHVSAPAKSDSMIGMPTSPTGAHRFPSIAEFGSDLAGPDRAIVGCGIAKPSFDESESYLRDFREWGYNRGGHWSLLLGFIRLGMATVRAVSMPHLLYHGSEVPA